MFTSRFLQLLNTRNITAYNVAKNTSISQGLMNEYKNGIKLPTIQNLIKIADYLDCSVDYLLGRTDNPDVNKSGRIVTEEALRPSEEEAELLRIYETLNLKGRTSLMSFAFELEDNINLN